MIISPKKEAMEDVESVPVYTTKPTACSVFLTVHPRSSRLSIPAPTFSLSGFSLHRQDSQTPHLP